MIDNFNFKENYSCDDLINIVKILRAPGGCPWDAEQTHQSIKKSLIEETYEVIEAINKESSEMLSEELGDLLLQVALHSEMEREKNTFDFDDVCDGICKKLIIRHPHVFGDVTVKSTGEVLTNWDAIKMQTKNQSTTAQSMESVPREFPALMRAQKLQHKASKVGFDWSDVSGALDKVYEEAKEVTEALKGKNAAEITEEIGDLLFAAVNTARLAGVDAEEALTVASDKFLRRFTRLEQKTEKTGTQMKDCSAEQLDSLWNEVKNEE